MGARLKILCDCDGILADFVGMVLTYVERNTGMRPLREAIDQWDCFAALNMRDHWPAFRSQCDALEMCLRAEALPGAREFYAGLRACGDVRVCTTPMTVAWLSQRAAWLEAFGVPLGEQIQCAEKEALAAPGVVLIDDRAENCVAFVSAGGSAFCIATPYNTHLVCVDAKHAPGARLVRGTHDECLVWVRAKAGEL
jgi:hypothetical protein